MCKIHQLNEEVQMKNILNRVVVVGIILMAASGATMAAAERLVIDGSTTVGPIADAWAEVFQGMFPKASISVQKTGSGNGIAALIDGRADVALSSRFMKASEFKAAVENGVLPVAHVVAIDGVCVVVHPSNPVGEMTIEQIRKIYSGKINNWKELGGPDMRIVVVSRDTSSGTYGSFTDAVMASEKMAESVEYVNSNPQAHARVRTTVGAIGYVGIGFLDENVKAVKVDGVAPTKQTIASGEYPISRAQYMFTNGYPKLGSIVHRYVTFYLNELGQELVESAGFIPLTSY